MANFILLVVAAIFSIFSFFVGDLVSLPVQLDLYEALRDVSAIVFGVMGAWLAIVHPDALSSINKSENIGAPIIHVDRVAVLVDAMVIATFVLVVSFLFPLFAALIDVPGLIYVPHSTVLQITFSICVLLTLSVSFVTLRTVGAAFVFLVQIRGAAFVKDSRNALQGTKSRNEQR